MRRHCSTYTVVAWVKREADGDPTLGSERDNGLHRRVYKNVMYLWDCVTCPYTRVIQSQAPSAERVDRHHQHQTVPDGQGGHVDVHRGPHESAPPQRDQLERVTDESRQAISGQTYTKRLEVKSSRMWLRIKSPVLCSLVVTTSSRTDDTVDNWTVSIWGPVAYISPTAVSMI